MDNKKIKDKYYAMLYNAVRVDSGAIAFRPNKLISGFYDAKHNLFYRDDVEGDSHVAMVDAALANFGNNDDHILDAVDAEISDVEFNDGDGYFAFPITSEELKKYAESSMKKEVTEEEVKNYYERIVRTYLLTSVYDEEINDSVILLTDKYTKEEAIDVDVSMDAMIAFDEALLANELEDMVSAFLNEEITYEELKEYCESADIELELIQLNIQDDSNTTTQQMVVKTQTKTNHNQDKKDSAFKPILLDFNPDVLEKNINSEVLGQDHVVRALITLLYKNMVFAKNGNEKLKSNMFILGPSGCGKTEIVRSVSRHLNIPMVIFDATSTSATGYVGNNINQCLYDLLAVCNNDLERAQNGIIVIDEVDKLADNSSDSQINKGDVQNELLKMLEGEVITVSGEYLKKDLRFDTKNVTFILIGSAQTLIDSKKKERSKKTIGFASDNQSDDKDEEVIITSKDLIDFGMKPELLRRVSVIKVVKNLKEKELKDILKNSKISDLVFYRKAFRDIKDVKLVCCNGYYDKVAEKAKKELAGASGLKRVVDDSLEIALRKVSILKGEKGTLVVTDKTVENPRNFKLYCGSGKDKKIVYEYKEENDKPKVKKLTTSK